MQSIKEEQANLLAVMYTPSPMLSFHLCINDFGKFFRNSGNKIRLQSFLKTQFSQLAKDRNESFKYTIGRECFDLVKMENKPIYTCDQHEADTKIFYHVSKMILDDAVTLIVIDAEDTDVVAIAAAVAHNLGVIQKVRNAEGVGGSSTICYVYCFSIVIKQ